MRSRFSSTFSTVRVLCALAGACLFVPALTGCDGGSSSSALTRGPVVSVPATSLGSAFTSETATLPFSGTNVTVRVEIASANALDVTANPPQIDIFGPGGTSVLTGRQPLQSLNSDPNGWVYVFNIPPGTPAQTYTFVVYAQDTFGNKGNTPFTVGTQKF